MDLLAIIKIAALLALIVFIVLAVMLIFSLNSIMKLIKETNTSLYKLTADVSESVGKITTDVNNLTNKMIDSLGSVDNASKQLVLTTQSIESEADKIFGMIRPFKSLIDLTYNRVAPPINQVSTIISAASKAVGAFVNVLSKRR